ncbi:MAG: hypothetical protein QF728_05735 [Arenicellales bacterium]|jgi:hypothetical protein|nr:hypothetical protein [Arenicellales bacterium]|tara:strand:- start:37 stop:432 length:396 start_codon:yes stop_codon:yes gene_type:complete
MQKNMMYFTIAAAVLYGLWFFFAPGSYMAVMMFPEDQITDPLTNQLQQTGLALLVIAYWINVSRSVITQDNISTFMQHHAVGWGIFGVGGVYLLSTSGNLTVDNPFLYQNIVFLIIASAFYFFRGGRTDVS